MKKFIIRQHSMNRIMLLCFIFTLFLNFTTAQTLNLNQFGIEEGLPQSSIYTMLQGQDGSIWVGTMNGVSKYNGLNFENFNKKDGLTENRVTSSMQDKEGNIWFGHWSGGISSYNSSTKTFSEIIPGEIKLSKTITCILQDRAGNIWIGTKGEGLIKRENGNFKAYTTTDGLSSMTINALLLRKDGTLWIGTENGITVYTNKFAAENIVPSKSVTSFLEDSKGNSWVGTADQGVFRITTTGEKKNFTTAAGLVSNSIKVLFEARNGAVFIGTNSGGISKYTPQLEVENYKGSLFTTISTRHGLSNDHIYSIIQDREKNIWIGTQLNLNQYFDEQFEIFGENDGLKNSLVWSVIQDKNKNFWIGTEGGLVKFIPDIHSSGSRAEASSGNRVRHQFINKTGRQEEVLNTGSLYEDASGNIWYTDFGKGVTCFNPVTNTSKHFTKQNGLPVNEIYAINGDKDGNIWIGTNKGGLVKYDGKKENFQTYTIADGLGSNQIYSIYRDSKNRMWFGTLSGGLTLMDPETGTFSIFSEKEGYTANFTLCITEDKQGNLWFGSFDNGLYKYDGKSFKNYSTKDGLSSETPFLLVCDNSDNLWIGTGLGIDKFNLKDETFKHYEKQDGFLGIEINPNAGFKDADGNLWFGSIVGLVKYNSKLAKNNTVEAITSINEPRIFFQNVKIPEDHVFSWNQNHITFDFIGTSLTNPKRVKYRYFLEGEDKEWSPIVKDNSVTYPDLEPGVYTFNVRSSNNDGVWNKEPVTFQFEISAPFWKKSWFYFSLLILIIIIGFSVSQIRERNLKRANIILERKVTERTEIISKQKDEIEKKNSVIIDSIEYAKNIQQSILPGAAEMKKVFNRYFVLYKPKDIVSGDFYWLHENEERILFAVADCTGHGVPGAFMSIMGYNLLNETVSEKKDASPADILSRLNNKVLDSLKQYDTSTSAKYGMDISLISLKKDKSQLEFAGAHNSLLIFRQKECIQLKADRLSVGSQLNDEVAFTNHSFTLQKGDVLYMYTDGYVDQSGGPENKKFFQTPFRELVLSIYELQEEEQRKILDETIMKWKGDKSQVDDILVIGIRV